LIHEFSGVNDSVFDPVAAGPTVVGTTSPENEVEITAIACHPDGQYIACGKDDGAVTLYSTQDGTEIRVLYNHAQRIAINFLVFSPSSNLIASADASSRCMVYRLVRSDNAWTAEGPLLDARVQDYSISQILFDPTNKRLLVSTIASDIIYDIEHGLRQYSALQERRSWKWIAHPCDSEKLVHLTVSAAHVHTWDDITDAGFCAEIKFDTDMSEETFLKDVTVCSDGRKLSVEFAKGNNQQSASRVLLIPSSSFEVPFAHVIKPLALFNRVSAEMEHIIGSVGRKLLFLDRRMWVCSLDLETFKGEYLRHFFIPQDWLSINRNLILRVTSKGDFVFIKKHEVAVIKHGMENKEIVNIGTI
jgi:hypothetical protein